MSKISKYLKLDKNILLEYIYNDGNLISEPYKIIVNSKYKTYSYASGDSSVTNNTTKNQLFKIDSISNRWGKIDTNNYSFLQVKDYSSGTPTRFDTVKIHLPINWTFGEYIGFYIRVYAYDNTNTKTYDISNFYFDISDVSTTDILNLSAPPLLFQEKLWGKYISIDIPSVNVIASQLNGLLPKEDSLNYYLTNGDGLNSTSPIFIDFHFINQKQTINDITSYILSSNITAVVPQTPEFDKIGLVVEHSSNGDYFEIYGVYNDTINGFSKFI